MTKLAWDQTGERLYETGVDHGVVYQIDPSGEYVDGTAWNGLTTVTESPSGAEANPQYADNIKYLNLYSAEVFGGTIEAYTYPDVFEQNDGSAAPTPGVSVGQQTRKPFGFCYRSFVGNDIEGQEFGYKLHLLYGCTASPSEKAHSTVNDSPEAVTFSWELNTVPVPVGTVGGIPYKPVSSIAIDSTKVDPAKLAILEDQLYGTVSEEPSMPLPADVIAMMSAATTLATPTAPTYNSTTDLITIPTVTGVVYTIDGEVVTGDVGPITANKLVRAHAEPGYHFPTPVQDEWLINFS